MIKILYLRTVHWFDLKGGGSVTHTSGVVNALEKNKAVSLDVIANDHLFGVKHPVKIVPPIIKSIPFFNEFLYNFKIIWQLSSLENCNYIYQRFSGASFCGAYLAQRYNIPFILEFNSSEVWKLNNWSRTNNPLKNFVKGYIQLPLTRLIESYNLRKAKVIVVVSKPLKENLTQQGINPNKILVNPNGVDLEKYYSQEDKGIKKKLGLTDKKIFGFIGTFGKWHGVEELAKAIILFFDRYPKFKDKVHFLLIGDGKLGANVRNFIETSNYKENVTFTGLIPQQQSPAYLSICDYFLSPHIPNKDGTKFFGSPTKLFEYMALKKPIIASNLDQIGEILTHHKTAILVEPGNISELANAMQQLISNEPIQQKIAQNAFELVKENYTWDKHVEYILDFASTS